NFSPGDISGMLGELGSTLQHIATSLNPSGAIPFVSKKISDIVDFTTMATNLTNKLSEPAIIGNGTAVATGQLSGDPNFAIVIAAATPVNVTVPASSTTANTSIDDLVNDINTALPSGLKSSVQAQRKGNQIVLVAIGSSISQLTIQIASATDPAATQLGF